MYCGHPLSWCPPFPPSPPPNLDPGSVFTAPKDYMIRHNYPCIPPSFGGIIRSEILHDVAFALKPLISRSMEQYMRPLYRQPITRVEKQMER
jgi:hypothetical protein